MYRQSYLEKNRLKKLSDDEKIVHTERELQK